MEQKLSIITLGVVNLQRSIKFYESQLGWKRNKMSNDNIVFFDMGNIMLSLYNREMLADDIQISSAGDGFKGFTIAYNTKTKEEVDDIFALLENTEAHIIKKPESVFWGGYSGYFADPDNNIWEVAYNPFI